MREVRRTAGREPGDPITATDNCVCLKVKKLDILANRGGSDGASFFHDEAIWKNPSEPDASGRMNLETELFFKK